MSSGLNLGVGLSLCDPYLSLRLSLGLMLAPPRSQEESGDPRYWRRGAMTGYMTVLRQRAEALTGRRNELILNALLQALSTEPAETNVCQNSLATKCPGISSCDILEHHSPTCTNMCVET